MRWLERLLLAAGLVLLAAYVLARLHGSISSHLALQTFEKGQAAASQERPVASMKSEGDEETDFSLWAEKRIQAYKESLAIKSDMPMAVLQIDRLRIRVPVFEGTEELALNRGVGHIIGTAKLGEAGNIGIAGHRDGFFRGLKDISVGDRIELVMSTRASGYEVDQIEIVSPDDVRVLQPRSAPSLTLVTCYPFYFVGDAPKRFIVHASLASDQPSNKAQANFSSTSSQP